MSGRIWQWRRISRTVGKAYHRAMSGFVSSRQAVNPFTSWVPAALLFKQEPQDEDDEEDDESGGVEDQDDDNGEGYSGVSMIVYCA
jgi:hypothetical protein